jgi:uncharacterized membrane protein
MRIEESVTIDAPRERVWELIHDPASYPGLLDWITSFDRREEDQEPEVGARYDMRVRVGSANVGGLVEIVEYDPECEVVWTSVSGVEQRGRLRVRPARGEEKTRLTMRISYGAPGASRRASRTSSARPRAASAPRSPGRASPSARCMRRAT